MSIKWFIRLEILMFSSLPSLEKGTVAGAGSVGGNAPGWVRSQIRRRPRASFSSTLREVRYEKVFRRFDEHQGQEGTSVDGRLADASSRNHQRDAVHLSA